MRSDFITWSVQKTSSSILKRVSRCGSITGWKWNCLPLYSKTVAFEAKNSTVLSFVFSIPNTILNRSLKSIEVYVLILNTCF